MSSVWRKHLLSENNYLRLEIEQSKIKRIEASNEAEKLAEDNYNLRKCLCNVNFEVYNLKREYQSLLDMYK